VSAMLRDGVKAPRTDGLTLRVWRAAASWWLWTWRPERLLTARMLLCRRPATGIAPRDLQRVIGQRTRMASEGRRRAAVGPAGTRRGAMNERSGLRRHCGLPQRDRADFGLMRSTLLALSKDVDLSVAVTGIALSRRVRPQPVDEIATAGLPSCCGKFRSLSETHAISLKHPAEYRECGGG